jgi:hypothetical protein
VFDYNLEHLFSYTVSLDQPKQSDYSANSVEGVLPEVSLQHPA